jgi:hypothetical protein
MVASNRRIERPNERKGNMLDTTIDLIRSGLKTDPTVTPAERARVIAVCRKGSDSANPTAPPSNMVPRVIRRAEVARRLSISIRTVDKLRIRKIKLPGRTRAAGFLESDINGLLK